MSYRRLGIPELDALTGAGVFYGASVSEAHAMTGRRVVVVGGGSSAGQAALHLARYADTVSLPVRSAHLGTGMSAYLVRQIAATDIAVQTDCEVVGGGGAGRLRHLTVRRGAEGAVKQVLADDVFVIIGAQPRTGWLPDAVHRDAGGFVECGASVPPGSWTLERAPHPFETSSPGLFAVGDVRNGSVKRVASAVGEGSVVVAQIHQLLAAQP